MHSFVVVVAVAAGVVDHFEFGRMARRTAQIGWRNFAEWIGRTASSQIAGLTLLAAAAEVVVRILTFGCYLEPWTQKEK